jgi:myo-inositol-1(or 4)-monophosphatase
MTRHLDARGTEHENASYDLDVSTKSNPADLATAIDVLNEDFIVREIASRFPAHRIIGEESTGSGAVDPVNDPGGPNTWIIDPIDGTTNFASGLPLCCVSIGMCAGGRPVMGVVYAPATDELYVAVRGRGAYRNGARLVLPSSSGAAAATRTLSDSVVGFEFGYTARAGDGVDLVVGAVARLLRHGVRATRSLGSGVLDLCYVASGRLDVVYAGVADEGWRLWDYCAGLVVAIEAGCAATHLVPRCEGDVDAGTGETRRGYEFNLLSRSVICGVNAELVEQTRRVVLGL